MPNISLALSICVGMSTPKGQRLRQAPQWVHSPAWCGRASYWACSSGVIPSRSALSSNSLTLAIGMPCVQGALRDVQNDMRDHFEGTPLDMTADMTAGPWGMPVRPLPMHFKASDGTSYFRERAIATQQSGFTMTCQMRSWLPDDVGGVT